MQYGYKQKYYTTIKKGAEYDTCNNMDETQKHAKWNNADAKNSMLYNSIYIKFPEKAKL